MQQLLFVYTIYNKSIQDSFDEDSNKKKTYWSVIICYV